DDDRGQLGAALPQQPAQVVPVPIAVRRSGDVRARVRHQVHRADRELGARRVMLGGIGEAEALADVRAGQSGGGRWRGVVAMTEIETPHPRIVPGAGRTWMGVRTRSALAMRKARVLVGGPGRWAGPAAGGGD